MRLMTRDELLAAVIAERLDCRWFPTPTKTAHDIRVDHDDEVTTARRRRALVPDAIESGHWTTRRGVQVWEVSA